MLLAFPIFGRVIEGQTIERINFKWWNNKMEIIFLQLVSKLYMHRNGFLCKWARQFLLAISEEDSEPEEAKVWEGDAHKRALYVYICAHNACNVRSHPVLTTHVWLSQHIESRLETQTVYYSIQDSSFSSKKQQYFKLSDILIFFLRHFN